LSQPTGDGHGNRPVEAHRDRPRTPFSSILERLVDTTPGAVSATFADDQGEAVDYHGRGNPVDIMLSAAHMGLLVNRLEALRRKIGAGPLEELRLSCEQAQYVTRPLGGGYLITVVLEGYLITVVLEPVATLPKLDLALELAMVQLRIEAGGVID